MSIMASDSEDELGALDLTSRKFDALKALYSKNVRLPIPKAPVLDNIHKYRSALDHRAKKQSAKVDKDSEPGPSSEHPKRRFLPHQLPVRDPRPQRVLSNVLTRMQNVTGPLSVLCNCMERRVRIKVRAQGFFGYYVASHCGFEIFIEPTAVGEENLIRCIRLAYRTIILPVVLYGCET